MLNNRLVAELIRQRMGWPDDSQAARVINLIPEALKAFGRSYAADPFTRPLVTTPKATTTVAIGARGQVNLATGYDTYQFLLEYLDKGQMYFLPSVTANPYILSGGEYASGYWTFNANPQQGETIAVNGVTFTFSYGNAVVASAGTAGANGTYTYTGQYNGKPYYLLNGVDPLAESIFWDGDYWLITDVLGNTLYLSSDVTALPWDVTTWTALSGSLPVPTVSVSALTSVQVEIEATLSATIANFITTLNASANASISVATYTIGEERGTVIGTYDTQGTGGNSFTLANSSLASVVRSGATFTGGASTAYALAIGAFTTYFDELSRVQFTTTGSLPTGISASTNYYLTDYTIDGETATFGLSSTVDGLTPVTISTAGSGVLTMVSSNKEVCQWLESPNQGMLTPAIPIPYIYIWLEKDLLYTSTTAGTFSFAVPFIPKNVESVPSQLLNDLVDEVVQIALTAGFEEITPAEK